MKLVSIGAYTKASPREAIRRDVVTSMSLGAAYL